MRSQQDWIVKGYVRRGPDFDQTFEGWQVFAHPRPGIDVPVTLYAGHVDLIERTTEKGQEDGRTPSPATE